jgi:hypothetical protein
MQSITLAKHHNIGLTFNQIIGINRSILLLLLLLLLLLIGLLKFCLKVSLNLRVSIEPESAISICIMLILKFP